MGSKSEVVEERGKGRGELGEVERSTIPRSHARSLSRGGGGGGGGEGADSMEVLVEVCRRGLQTLKVN